MAIIAIDGPSGVGKSSTAKLIAKTLGWSYMDTGAMYRAVTLALMQAQADVRDWDTAGPVLASMAYEQRGGSYYLGGKDISADIRSPEVTKNVSAVSAEPKVRDALVKLQQELGKNGDWVVDGRDIGTVVFPEAACKIFLVATPEARAHRRMLELQAKGLAATFGEVLSDQARRDHIDSTREASPLCKAADAVELDSSDLGIEEVAEAIIAAFRAKR